VTVLPFVVMQRVAIATAKLLLDLAAGLSAGQTPVFRLGSYSQFNFGGFDDTLHHHHAACPADVAVSTSDLQVFTSVEQLLYCCQTDTEWIGLQV